MSLSFRSWGLAVWLALAAAGVSAQTVEVEGIKLPVTTQVGPATAVLNGAGLRTRVFFKVYLAALYLPAKTADANAALAQKGNRRMTIHMLRDVDAATFSKALTDGLRDNHTEAQMAAMKAATDALVSNLKIAGEAKKGDVIQFEFTHELGTRLLVNNQPKGTPIAGDEFFSAVLRVWLGEKPADEGLKKGLLGG